MDGRLHLFKKKLFAKIFSRIVVALLVLSMFPGLATFTSLAEDAVAEGPAGETAGIERAMNGRQVYNAYVLDVNTGVNPGDFISYFQIKYKSGGKEYKQLVFPKEDSENTGRKVFLSAGGDKDTWAMALGAYGYTPKNDVNAKGESLRRYKESMFYFTLPHKIDQITSIDAFANTVTSKEWTCQGLRVFEVEEIYGLNMVGVWSNDWYMDFKGHLIAELVTQHYNWNVSSPGMLRMDRAANGSRINTDFKNIEYANRVTQLTKTYGFRIDFADLYEAGFESLASVYDDGQKPVDEMGLSENLTLNITYTDVYGQTRFAHLPAITSTAIWLTRKGAKGPYAGIAQQGESLAFSAELPDCKDASSITGLSLSVGYETAALDAEIQPSSATFSNTDRRKKREDASKSDKIRITAAAIYDMQKCVFSPYAEGALLRYTFSGTPTLYYISGSSAGDEIPIKQATGISLHPADENTKLEHFKKKTGYYLVQIQTDSMTEAATDGDLSIKLKYRTEQGIAKETEDLAIKDQVNQYYGYWPGSVENFAYRYSTAKGGLITLLVDIPGLDYFTGATLSMGANGDDYQLASIKIYELTSIGTRKAEWKDIGRDKVKSHLEYYREFDGKDLAESKAAVVIGGIDEPVLIQPGDRIPIDFTSNTIEEKEDNKFDIDEYQIPYADAMKNFGFTTARKDYEVTVKVYDDVVGLDGGINSNAAVIKDRDSGSNNHFFFQIVFAKGDSGIVLANQLLEADRFQSGGEHTFHINTNLDYGDVLGVRIIPDDFTESADPYDKLNIEKVSIIEGDTVGTHRLWEINDIGWVGINYTEEAEKTTGKAGRSLSDLTKTYPVDHIANVLEIEFSLQTGIGDKSEGINPSNNKMERIYCDQFVGKLWGDVTYIDNQGQSHTRAYDLVEAMYKYRKKTVSSSEQGVQSDPAWMLREGHTDRFILAIPDLQSVKAIKITAKDSVYGNYLWNISGVSGRLVETRGRLRLNQNDEYEYEIPTTQGDEEMAVPFTQASGTNPAHTLEINSNANSVYIPFNENSFKLDTERGIAKSVYSRLPLSKDDEMNIYVFPNEDQFTTDISAYDLGCKIYYAHPGGLFRTGDTLDKFYGDGVSRSMFYKTGLKASSMTDVNRVIFSASAPQRVTVKLDYAIIQQVRQGTVVATYFVDCEGDNPYLTEIEKFPTRDTSVVGYSEFQNVGLQLGAGTDTIGLYKERADVGISIDYKTSFDPNGPTYHSPIVYLTDQKINQIKDGKVVDLKFEQFFVGEVVGINVVSFGSLTASVDCGYVSTYHKDAGGNETLQGWYSFGTGVVARGGDEPEHMVQTANVFDHQDSVKPLTFTFTTAGPSENYESGSRDPVRATVYTTDYNGEAATPLGTIPDLRKYITEGQSSFFTGQTQKVKMLITGAQNIRRIRLEPVRGDGTGGWSIQSAAAQLGDDVSATRTVGRRFYEGSPEDITFANITLSARVMNFNPTRNANDTTTVTNDSISILTVSGKPVYIEPTANGSELGVEIKVVEVLGEGQSGSMSSYLAYEAGRYVFNTPVNQSGKTRYYKITANSVENPGAKVEINITVDTENPNANKTYTVLITGEGGDNSTQHKEGETVTIKAPVIDGKTFSRWLVQSGGAALADVSSAETTFTMPANDVNIKAEYIVTPTPTPETKYSVQITCSGCHVENPVTEAAEGATITIMSDLADVDSGIWSVTGIDKYTISEDNNRLVITMPANAINVVVICTPKANP